MTDETMILKLSSNINKRLEAISAVTNRSKSVLAKEAMTRFIETQEEYIEGIKEAREQIARGEHFTHQEVMASLDALIDTYEKQKSIDA